MMERFREYHRTGDRRIRNEIVVQYRYIADRYALRYGTRGVPVEDLRQTALLAIIRATDRFDPDMGVEFATFASRTVDGELKRWLRDKSWAVRPPRSAQERHLTLRRIDEQLTHRLGRSPNVNELAEAMGETVGKRSGGDRGRRCPHRRRHHAHQRRRIDCHGRGLVVRQGAWLQPSR